jgi:chromosome segregation ATPase
MRITETMDLTQAMQTVRWLDEERRKDKAVISTLEERAEEQSKRIEQQAAQIKALQKALSGVQGVLSKVNAFEEMVSNYRNELLNQMDQRDETRRKELTESERLRRIEYESLIANVNRLEKELRVLPHYDEAINGLRSENQRLSTIFQQTDVEVADLSKRIEDSTKPIPHLEEQRRVDNRRIVNTEQDVTDLRRKLNTLEKKYPLLEEAIQKQRPLIERAMEEVKKYEEPLEELRISDFQREQKMRQYLDQGELVTQELEKVRSQTQGFIEQQQAVKRTIDALEKFKVRIERRQDEMAERQRLTNEQIQRRWDEWQIAREKAQQKRDVVVEEKWRQQEQINQTYLNRIEALQSTTKKYREQMSALWESQRANANSLLKAVQDVYEIFTEPIDEQLGRLRGES